MLKKIVIAIDGYSACGKSTTAKALAENLNYYYIDSGAMYRAVTLYFLENHVPITNPKEVNAALNKINIEFKHIASAKASVIFLNGLNVERQIREMRISENVSQVSTLVPVRKAMVEQQRKFGKKKGVVMDGRDIGTVVFPDAELKIFMNADMDIRAYRRQKELLEHGELVVIDEVIKNLEQRDLIDSPRSEGPLKRAEDAVLLDTSHITLDEQIELATQMALSRILAQ
ncbi:MAG TPA: (d)CMP kinase [Cyclobacteriaceae bacterium]|nr:(d)CMP kinase [Cyclobacteriaceae bacterium]